MFTRIFANKGILHRVVYNCLNTFILNAILFAFPVYAQSSMQSGTMLNKDEFLYSNNKKFKMGLDDKGSLYISNTAEGLVNRKVSYGEQYYAPLGHYWIAKWDKLYRYADFEAVHAERHENAKHGKTWGLSNTCNPNLCIYGINPIYKSDGSDYIIWSTKIKSAREKVYLVLEDFGRAVIFGESGKLYWCSCSYCRNASDGVVVDYYWNNMPPDRPEHRMTLRHALMGMPTHQEAMEMARNK